jgi:hypothetical protein
MAAAFEIDRTAERLDLFAKAPLKGTEAAWAAVALELAEEASTADDYETALKLSARAEALAKAANDRSLQKTAEDRPRSSRSSGASRRA